MARDHPQRSREFDRWSTDLIETQPQLEDKAG